MPQIYQVDVIQFNRHIFMLTSIFSLDVSLRNIRENNIRLISLDLTKTLNLPVGELSETFRSLPCLQEIDLTRCPTITGSSLYRKSFSFLFKIKFYCLSLRVAPNYASK